MYSYFNIFIFVSTIIAMGRKLFYAILIFVYVFDLKYNIKNILYDQKHFWNIPLELLMHSFGRKQNWKALDIFGWSSNWKVRSLLFSQLQRSDGVPLSIWGSINVSIDTKRGSNWEFPIYRSFCGLFVFAGLSCSQNIVLINRCRWQYV